LVIGDPFLSRSFGPRAIIRNEPENSWQLPMRQSQV